MEIFLLTLILLVCIFNAVSTVIVGAAVARMTENIEAIAMVLLQRGRMREPGGHRYDPGNQLDDLQTPQVLRQPMPEDLPELQNPS